MKVLNCVKILLFVVIFNHHHVISFCYLLKKENNSSMRFYLNSNYLSNMEHLDIYLLRSYYREKYIIGQLFINDVKFCDTFEPSPTMPHPCIPTGQYKITLNVQSPKFKNKYPYKSFCNGLLPRLLNVPGRDGILIHIGNGFNANGTIQSAGCILVGKNEKVGSVLHSTRTFIDLYNILKQYKSITIHILCTPCDKQSLHYVSNSQNNQK